MEWVGNILRDGWRWNVSSAGMEVKLDGASGMRVISVPVQASSERVGFNVPLDI